MVLIQLHRSVAVKYSNEVFRYNRGDFHRVGANLVFARKESLYRVNTRFAPTPLKKLR